MDASRDIGYVLTHWAFGLTILVGLIASEYSAAESIVAICVAAATTTLSGEYFLIKQFHIIVVT